ncbi:FAD binding domain containing protein [Apiospora phragmitis]|uniref:FAD binding domain containing protein n=1 Tax=Apiospora phragmitis TaxID=2905665 RepID=A0ABR1WVY6_9PEZI
MEMSSQVSEEVDLVIVGGGPTGLLCAVLAQQTGLSVYIIDEKPSTLQAGRADGLNARTQQYLEVAGALYELRPKGIDCNTSSTFANGELQSRQSTWWTSLEHCHHKNMLIVGQPEVEKVLLHQLQSEHPDNTTAIVRFGHRVKSVSEDIKGVTVTSDDAAGRDDSSSSSSIVTTRAKFAIGADGARSMVRQGLGIGFHGTQPEMVWAVLDTFVATDFPLCPEIISLQLGGQCRVLWIPRERGMSRFYIRLLEGRVITQEAAEATIREHMAPYRVDFVRTEWFIKERVASTFVSGEDGRGRIFLAGDAAHCHSVNGAQGLNTGIADAFGLIWRIALACGKMKVGPGSNGDSMNRIAMIMKSYDTERRAVAQNAVSLAAQLVRNTRHSAKQYVATIEKNAGYITGEARVMPFDQITDKPNLVLGMGVAYDEMNSLLVVASERGIWKAGTRCPDLRLHPCFPYAKTVDDHRLYQVARRYGYGRFLVLVLGNKMNYAQAFRNRFGQAANVVNLMWRGLAWAIYAATKGRSSAKHSTCAIRRARGQRAYGSAEVEPSDSFTVVVRPDMYIGYVGDKEGVLAYMAKMLG